jgi:hypothetical protein
LNHERLIDRSWFGFASAVFKDRQEVRRGVSAGGLSKLNSMQPARRPLAELGLEKVRRPGPVDVLDVGSIADPEPRRGAPARVRAADDESDGSVSLTCPLGGSLERR